MASFLITRLPLHPKSLEAVEFMQRNNISFRLSSNFPLMDCVMSSGGGDSQLATAVGLPEEFELEKEEIHFINEMTEIKVEVESRENSPPNENPNECIVKEEDEMSSVGQSNGQNDRLEMLPVAVQPVETTEFPMVDAENPFQMDVGQAEEEEVDDHHEEREMNVNDGGAVRLETADDVLDAVYPDAAAEVYQPTRNFGEFALPFDACFDEDLHMEDEEKVENSDAVDMEDNEKMEELSKEQENGDEGDKEKQIDECSDKDDDERMASVDDEEAKNKKSTARRSSPVGRRLFTCPVKNCPSSYTKFKYLDAHMKVHSGKQEFFCDVCKKSFSAEKEAISHIKKREQKKCCKCRKKSLTRPHLLLHLRQHSGEKPYVCKTCNEFLARASQLQKHVFLHTGEKPYSCGHCGEGFFAKSNLKTHELTHTGRKPFECRHCGREFKDRSTSKGHSCVDAARSVTRSLIKAEASWIT